MLQGCGYGRGRCVTLVLHRFRFLTADAGGWSARPLGPSSASMSSSFCSHQSSPFTPIISPVQRALFKIVVRETAAGPEALGFIFEHPSTMGQHGGLPRPLPNATWVNCNQRVSRGHTYDHTSRLTSMTEIAQLWRRTADRREHYGK